MLTGSLEPVELVWIPPCNECKCQILLLIYPYTYRHYHLINIYTELAPKFLATASVAQW